MKLWVFLALCVSAAGCCAPILTKRLESGDRELGTPYSLPRTELLIECDVVPVPEVNPPKPPTLSMTVLSKSEETQKPQDTTRTKSDSTEVRAQDLRVPAGSPWGAGKEFQIALKVTPERVPDPQCRFVLRREDNWFYDDDLEVKIGVNGFLEEISLTTEDKTLEVVKTLAETAITVAKILAVQAPTGGATPKAMFGPGERPALLDEIRKAEVLRLLAGKHRRVSSLPRRGDTKHQLIEGQHVNVRWIVNLEVVVEPMHENSRTMNDCCSILPDDKEGTIHGVVVKVPEPFKVTVQVVYREPVGARYWVIAHSESLILAPDYSPIVKVPVTRYAFVKTVASIGLRDGVVTRTKVTKGSQVLAVAALPLDIAREVAKLPTEIIQLKFDLSTKQRELIEAEQKLEAAREAARRGDVKEDEDLKAEKARLQSEIELLKLKIELDELKKKVPPDS